MALEGNDFVVFIWKHTNMDLGRNRLRFRVQGAKFSQFLSRYAFKDQFEFIAYLVVRV